RQISCHHEAHEGHEGFGNYYISIFLLPTTRICARRANFSHLETLGFGYPSRQDAKNAKFGNLFLLCAFASLREMFRFFLVAASPRRLLVRWITHRVLSLTRVGELLYVAAKRGTLHEANVGRASPDVFVSGLGIYPGASQVSCGRLFKSPWLRTPMGRMAAEIFRARRTRRGGGGDARHRSGCASDDRQFNFCGALSQ